MSVLNQSGEEQVECPLCMESLEVDDLNFFPCTCGYQICRFCWHRIRLDENGGLCPACRKAYSENPADFIPLSQEQVAKLKSEKRQRDQQRKAKLTESRKHLATVRVVQRNLVFVVGLPPRLADAEILKRHEYFGKFGKIHKVVINQSTAYAGSQGPSASAYVTYMKSDDALRAIQAVNNVTIDNRLIKSSLGTTKYCSHFMKNQACPKPDCMYLHEYGDPDASFTKEQMHVGKHQEYEKRLHEELLSRGKGGGGGDQRQQQQTAKQGVKETSTTSSNATNSTASSREGSGANKENWPQLNLDKEKEKKDNEKGRKGKTKGADVRKDKKDFCNVKIKVRLQARTTSQTVDLEVKDSDSTTSPAPSSEPTPSPSPPPLSAPTASLPPSTVSMKAPPPPSLKRDDNTSFFSAPRLREEEERRQGGDVEEEGLDAPHHHSHVLTDGLTEDWAAAFGFAGREHSLLLGQKHHQQQQPQQQKLSTFGGFGPSMGHHEPSAAFGKAADGCVGFYEISKMQDSLMGALAGKTNGYSVRQQEPQTHMSNGFGDFHKFGAKEPPSPVQYQNGFNGLQSYHHNLLMQQQLEEQLMNLGLKAGYGGNQTTVYQNGLGQTSQPYSNGDSSPLGLFSKHQQQSQQQQLNSRSSEDELDFDPFQETQKALAEMMANERCHKNHTGAAHHSQGGHVPPPPPGFLHQQQQQQQQGTHMNSFGSKILPYLSMSNSQQINSSTNNWPSSFNNTQLQQQKNLANTCNDWKVLDPAILSTSARNYPLSQLPPVRDHYANGMAQAQMQNGAAPRQYDAFSNFAQQLQQQPGFGAFASAQQSLWFNGDLGAQISSPPGFRNGQTSKQQEC